MNHVHAAVVKKNAKKAVTI